MCHRMTAWILIALGLTVASEALAIDDPFGWTEPDPPIQLEQDETPIPVGQGAVFVPSMTGPLNEPPSLLVDETSDQVVDIPTGQRVIVDPGTYVVIVGSGSPGQGVGQAIEVLEGETAMVPVTWGALRVEVVGRSAGPPPGGLRADPGRHPRAVRDRLRSGYLQG